MGRRDLGRAGHRPRKLMASGVTYDTSALIAAERREERVWRLHRRVLDRDAVPIVPAGVLAQAWRGGSGQYWLSRFLTLCRIEDLDEHLARRIGVICHQHDVSDVVDASVVAGASQRGDEVVTSDQRDVGALAGSMGVPVRRI